MNAFLEAEQIDLFRIVHGDQKFAYERPVVPGDVLTATLTVASLRQIGGADIIGTTQRDHRRRRGAGLRHLRHPGPPGRGRMSTRTTRRSSPSPAPTWCATPAPAATTTRSTRTSGSPRSVGLPGVIAHGMFTMALAARAVVDLVPPAPRSSSCGCKFTKPGRRPGRRAASTSRSPASARTGDGRADDRGPHGHLRRREGARHAQGGRACLSSLRRPHHPAARRPGPRLGRGDHRGASWSTPCAGRTRRASRCSSSPAAATWSSPTTASPGTVVEVATRGVAADVGRPRRPGLPGRGDGHRRRRRDLGRPRRPGRRARAGSGIEALSGIPGSVGATPIQNVGAYGQEVSETIARSGSGTAARGGSARSPPPTAASATGPAGSRPTPAATSCST